MQTQEERHAGTKRENEQLLVDLGAQKEEIKRAVAQCRLDEEKRLNEFREKTLLEQTELMARFDQERRSSLQQAEQQLKLLGEKLEKAV